MEVELTGRKVKVTKDLRAMADDGLARIERLVGRGATAHIVLGSRKSARIAEVTVNARHRKVVGLAEAPTLAIALRTALEKTEKQAIRWKKSRIEKKRKTASAHLKRAAAPASEKIPKQRARMGKDASANGELSGFHVVPAPDSMARRAMTLEEAVKEAESRAHPVYVFRDLNGDVKVLHCSGDGLVHLIEVSAD